MSKLERNAEISRAAFEFNETIRRNRRRGTPYNAVLHEILRNPPLSQSPFTKRDEKRAVTEAVRIVKRV